jgi:hypothetical protein
MVGSDSSVRGGNHGDDEPPVSRAEMHNMANSFVEAMERMLNERLLAARRRAPIATMNPVMKILVSGVVFVTIFNVVVMIMVVEGVLVMRIGVQEVIVIMIVVFALMMKMNLRAAMRRSIMMVRILLHTVDHLNVTENVIVLLVMMVTIVVVTIGLIRTALLVLNSVFQNLQERKMLMHILIGKSSVIKFSECIISLIEDVLALLPLNSMVMLSLGGIKYKKISFCWDVIISTHGLK